MSHARLVRISKAMTLMLRHDPTRFGVELDEEGFTPLADLLRGLRESIPDLAEDEVHRVLAEIEPDKGRFSLVGGDIRANYGHSFGGRVVHPCVPPPERLLHGTAVDSVPAIRREGLRAMRRQYVHLTTDPSIATRVGGRHGAVQVLVVEAQQAAAAGIAFYRANDSFWLARRIPPEFIR